MNRTILQFTTILLGALLVVQLKHRIGRSETAERPKLSIGLRPPATTVVRTHDGHDDRATLGRLFPRSGCVVMIVYDSLCQFSHDVAANWAGRTSITDSGKSALVAWIALRETDTERDAFAARYALPGPRLAFASMGDAAKWALWRTPELILVTPGGRFGGLVSRDPKAVVLPPACSTSTSPARISVDLHSPSLLRGRTTT